MKTRNDPTEDFNRYSGIFQQICQTMAYAHAKSVIHRDLKPANVMVGAFGEVQVIDWGLAKVLCEAAPTETTDDDFTDEASIIRTIRSEEDNSDSDGSSKTKYGSVLGTIAFMPPEQALGKVERIDTTADVFSLGAILCQILTGKPPYVGKDPRQLHGMAVRCDLTGCRERLATSDSDPSLVKLALNCLAAEPEDRLLDAGAVSARITAHLESVAQRSRTAEIEGAASQARAVEAVKTADSEHRRRRITTISAAAIVASFWSTPKTDCI